jgi:hypothetical protein
MNVFFLLAAMSGVEKPPIGNRLHAEQQFPQPNRFLEESK